MAVLDGEGQVVKRAGRAAMPSGKRSRQNVDAEVLAPPGLYGDGPVHIRVEKERAGQWRPPPGYSVAYNDPRCVSDPRFDYVQVVNTHNAFLYVDLMVNWGVPAAALSVVRLPRADGVGS
jgi:hypothetical protein